MTQNFHLRQKRKPFPLPPTPSHKISTTLQNVSWLFCTQTKPLASHVWNGTNPAASVSRNRQVWTLPSKHLHPLGNAISANAENVYCHADQNKPKGDDKFLKNPLTDIRFVFALFFVFVFLNGFYPYLVFHIPITKRNCQLNRKLEQPSTHAPFWGALDGEDPTWRDEGSGTPSTRQTLRLDAFGDFRFVPDGGSQPSLQHTPLAAWERVGISKAKCFFGVSLSQSTYVLLFLPSSLPAWRG